MLRAILSLRQHPTKQQLYGHLPPIKKTINVRQTRHAGYCWWSRDELISNVLLWAPHMAEQKQGDQHEPTYSNPVRIRDVALRICQKRWTIGRSGERGSGISVQVAWLDNDDDGLLTYKAIEPRKTYYLPITGVGRMNKSNLSKVFFSAKRKINNHIHDLNLARWTHFLRRWPPTTP